MAQTEPNRAPKPVIKIGRYRVIRKLGKSGQGIVYLAEDPDISKAPSQLPSQVNEDVDKKFDIFVAHALAKELLERYFSARECARRWKNVRAMRTL